MTRIGTAAIALAFCIVASTARADIYGYIDEQGVTHLATEKLNERYALFLKTGEGTPTARAAEPTGAADASNDALMKTRLFKRLVDHPNVPKFEPMIRAAALRHGLDPQLVKAVVAVESGFEPRAVSEKGAVGLMQILPATGERYGVRADRKRSVDEKLTDPTLNLEVGTRYLADLRKMFAARLDLALAAYNAGENAVVRFRNVVPPFPETQAYVKLVDQFHAFYNPRRNAVEADGKSRIRVTIPARRNLPDPNMPPRVPASNEAFTVPAGRGDRSDDPPR